MSTSSQNWRSVTQYTNEYLDLVYRYYAEAGISYICTYYNLNLAGSVIDDHTLDAGSYEQLGELSGLLWNRVMLFPVYNTETIQNTFISDERGMGKFDQISSFNFPTIYGLKPNIHDYVIFEDVKLDEEPSQHYRQQSITDHYKESKKPVYEVIHYEKAANTDQTFWKTNLKIDQITKPQIDLQLSGDYSYFDMEKHIYNTDETSTMYKMLEKNRLIEANKFFKQNCGFYFV